MLASSKPHCFLQAGEPYTALEVFRQIQQAGLAPNFVTYCGLISALGKVRRRGQPSAELAYQLWQELYQLQEPLDAAAFRTGLLSTLWRPLLYARLLCCCFSINPCKLHFTSVYPTRIWAQPTAFCK